VCQRGGSLDGDLEPVLRQYCDDLVRQPVRILQFQDDLVDTVPIFVVQAFEYVQFGALDVHLQQIDAFNAGMAGQGRGQALNRDLDLLSSVQLVADGVAPGIGDGIAVAFLACRLRVELPGRFG